MMEQIESTVTERFENIVRRYPDRLAVKMGDVALTYNELNKAANRIGHAIIDKRGLGSEPIALMFEHGIDAVAAIFGVLKAGKFYVALDGSFPESRVDFILNDSQTNLIVTNETSVELARKHVNESRRIINIGECYSSQHCDNLKTPIASNDLRTLRYTSGSTGSPKGVIYKHGTLLHDISMGKEVDIDDRLSLIHSLAFGSSNTHLFDSLLTGASLFPFDVKQHNVEEFTLWLQENALTKLHIPPSLFRQLAPLAHVHARFPNLRLISLSGEAISKSDFELYRDNFGNHTELEIRMGSTEARHVARAVVNHSFVFPEQGNPAGFGLPDAKLLILDGDGNPVEPGIAGEIAVRGRHLSDGYWHPTELDTSKFIPGINDETEQTYLTGDLGYLMPNGFLIHLGRKDFTVKIRGYRVNFGEIENALLDHPNVEGAAVKAWGRDSGEKFLAAYVCLKDGVNIHVEDLNSFLRLTLPDYMIPSTMTFLEELPLINGKLDRNALPRPHGKRPGFSQAYVPPKTEIEKQLVHIWEEVLDIRPIGIDDNLLDLGAHSLVAAQAITRIIHSCKAELSVKAFFDAPTVAKMAQVVAQAQALRSDSALQRMLQEIESLSDQEAHRLITNEKPPPYAT